MSLKMTHSVDDTQVKHRSSHLSDKYRFCWLILLISCWWLSGVPAVFSRQHIQIFYCFNASLSIVYINNRWNDYRAFYDPSAHCFGLWEHDVTVRSLLDSLMLILQKSADINLSCCDKLIESTVHEENSDFKTLHWLKIIFWIISHHIYVFVYLVYLFSENISLIIEVSQFLVDLIFCISLMNRNSI